MIQSAYKKGFFHLLSANFLTQFLGFGTSILLAKFLTPSEIGEVRIIQTYSAIFIIFGGFGFGSALLKFCSSRNAPEQNQFLFNFSLAGSLVASAVSVGALVTLSHLGLISASENVTRWMIPYSSVIVFSVLTTLIFNYLQSLKKIKEMSKSQSLLKLLSFILIVGATYAFGFPGFIWSTVAAYLIGLASLWQWLGLRVQLTAAHFERLPPGFMWTAGISFSGNAIAIIGLYTDMFMLDHLVSNRAEIGHYALANLFMIAAMQVTGTIQSITTPYFTENSTDLKWIKRQLWQLQGRSIFISLAVSMGVFLLAWLTVKYFLGLAYDPMLVFLPILLIRYMLHAATSLFGVAMFAQGRIGLNVTIATISTSTGLILSYWFIQSFGTVGAAWAQVVSAMISLFLQLALNIAILGRAHR